MGLKSTIYLYQTVKRSTVKAQSQPVSFSPDLDAKFRPQYQPSQSHQPQINPDIELSLPDSLQHGADVAINLLLCDAEFEVKYVA